MKRGKRSSHDTVHFVHRLRCRIQIRLVPLDLIRLLSSNPIEAWTKAHFEEPIVRTRLPFGEVVVVNDPAAVRRVLQENEANYCKDRFQKRMLAALSGGLLTAEDTHWYSQRRLIAPLFRSSLIKDRAPAMVAAIDGLVGGWTHRDRCVLDVAEETTDLALDVLERTIFFPPVFERSTRR
jgi:cytochrome P450